MQRCEIIEIFSLTIISILEDFTPIIIDRKDLEGIDMPHIDLLVLTLEITNIIVKRIFIDGGSSAKIFY